MGVIDSLFSVSSSTDEVGREKLSKADKAKFKNIESVEIKRSQKDGDEWLSMCFFMKDGTKKLGYLSTYSELEEGDKVDPKSIEVIYLEQNGEALLPRFDGEVLEEED